MAPPCLGMLNGVVREMVPHWAIAGSSCWGCWRRETSFKLLQTAKEELMKYSMLLGCDLWKDKKHTPGCHKRGEPGELTTPRFDTVEQAPKSET